MKLLKVLLVEDNQADVKLIKRALSQLNNLNYELQHVVDGEQALVKLNKEFYDLIILDLNLIKISGTEVVKIIKADEKLKSIPIVVLTTSNSATDVEELYKLGINAYVSKPFGLNQFTEAVQSLGTFWLRYVRYYR